MRLRSRSIALILGLALAMPAVNAYAAPLADKRAQARKVQAEVQALDTRLEIAAEDYNEAAERYGNLNAKVGGIKKRLSAIDGRTGTLQTSLNTRANSMYRSGPLGVLDVLLGAASFEDFASTWDFLNDLNAQESASVAELKSLRDEAVAKKAELEDSQAQARTVYKKMADRKAYAVRELARRKAMLQGLEGEIAALEAADRARRAADARHYRRSRPGSGTKRGTGWDWGSPTRAARGEVVSIAMKYLGCPYRWGATGPSSFDCSGLTSFVYAQVGVRLPRTSRAQIGAGQRVSRANLQPGDLVFFGSPIHHVGIYVGGGKMIHSPHTGDVVSIDPLSSDFSGACRP